MKSILKNIFINLITIYSASLLYPGFSVQGNFKTLLTAAIIWLLLNKIVKPIIKLLLLPINLITLNLFSWMVGFLTLFLLQVFADGVKLGSYQFSGFSSGGFSVPPFFINIFLSYLLTSILLNTIHASIVWLIRKEAE